MTHYRDAELCQTADEGENLLSTLDFHAICSAFFEEFDCRPDSLLFGRLESSEGKIGDE